MPDLFGAPLGIIASDENIRQNIHAGLLAQKTLGEIEQQPADLALKQAQLPLTQAQTKHQESLSRLNTAQAAAAEAQALELKRQQDISAMVLAEDRARQTAVQAAAAQGRTLTVGDIPAGGFAAPAETSAQRLDRIANNLLDKGMPLDKVAPLMAKAAEASKDNAAAASSAAETEVRKLTATRKRSEELGAMATYALQGPAQFRQAMAAAAQDPALAGVVGKIPTDFNQARPLLENFKAQAMTVKEQAAQRARDIEAQAASARAGAAQTSASASLMLAKKKVEVLDTRLAQIKKNGGEADPTVTDLRRERIAASQARREAADLKQFPRIPLDPKEVQLNQTYTLAGGQKARAVADPAGAVQNAAGKRFSLVPIAQSASDLTEEDLALINGE